jgi:hypothetical protein
MSGEVWSCFAQVPFGLIDPERMLTLNWLRPRPTAEGFRLSASDIDERRYGRLVRIQRAALIAVPALIACALLIFLGDAAFELGSFADPTVLFVAILAGVGSVSGAALTVIATALEIMQYQRAEPRREALRAAFAEFEQIDAWRAARCEPKFWSRGLNGPGFELEAAELMAGVFGTGQVALTRATDDYGVDILACAAQIRIIARCRQSDRRIGAAEVRELAGAKAYFDAHQAIMISLERPLDDAEQTNRIAERLELAFWNAEAIVAWAQRLRTGG